MNMSLAMLYLEGYEAGEFGSTEGFRPDAYDVYVWMHLSDTKALRILQNYPSECEATTLWIKHIITKWELGVDEQ